MNKISIVIPVYNAENTLRKCVESLVLGNHQENIEIILVDDQSTDGSWQLCLDLQEAFVPVRAIQNPQDSGPSYTRNRGIEEANGNLLLFVDSDDWVAPDYISRLSHIYPEYENALVLCGYRFIVEKTGEKKEYLYAKNNDPVIILDSPDRYFRLMEHTLFQQIWNKMFDLQVIKANHLVFDETQTMGEDTQFVLDYLRVAAPNRCVIINEPLYNYIRTDHSLMARYKTIDLTSDENRLKQLREISGEHDPDVSAVYRKAVDNHKSGLIYRIMHSDRSKQEKLSLIKKVHPEKNAGSIYKAYHSVIMKEKLAAALKQAKTYNARLKSHRINQKRGQIINDARKALQGSDFTVISQNCIGGVFYSDMKLQFLSPTVNLYFSTSNFLRFVNHLEEYLTQDLEMHMGENYPMGNLGDIAIHFMHYDSCKEAKDKWEKRKTRINWQRIVVFCTDTEGFTDSDLEQWNLIKYPKVLFTAQERYKDAEGAVYYPQYQTDGKVPDLIPKREFYKDGTLVSTVNQTCRE